MCIFSCFAPDLLFGQLLCWFLSFALIYWVGKNKTTTKPKSPTKNIASFWHNFLSHQHCQPLRQCYRPVCAWFGITAYKWFRRKEFPPTHIGSTLNEWPPKRRWDSLLSLEVQITSHSHNLGRKNPASTFHFWKDLARMRAVDWNPST